MKTQIILSMTLISALLTWQSVVNAEVVIIGHAKSGASLDAKTAKKLFLGKTKSVTGMTAVVLVGQIDSSPIKAEFTKKVTKKKLGAIR